MEVPLLKVKLLKKGAYFGFLNFSADEYNVISKHTYISTTQCDLLEVNPQLIQLNFEKKIYRDLSNIFQAYTQPKIDEQFIIVPRGMQYGSQSDIPQAQGKSSENANNEQSSNPYKQSI